ncbi:hypothetical protein ACQP1O_13025 [Nocardia sp. CA-151230]|uniref:hypothetical protein n=1 Tax=Nocardia sp. CA-151230 TaxID=3239982 RepID=UPI003D8E70D6
MHATRRSFHYIGWAATTLALAATTTALSAPAAFATVGPVEVLHCSPDAWGTCVTPPSYVVGQTYTIVSEYTPNVAGDIPYVDVYDNGVCVAGVIAVSDTDPGHHYTSVPWIPTTAGTHKITVNQRESASTTVTVVAAPPGSGTPQPPTQPACHGSNTGSGGLPGSGSSNLLGSGSAH